MQSAEMLLTVPKEYLKAPGGFNPNVTHVFQCLEPNNPIYLWLLAIAPAGLDLF
jgi:hypothetical protein